MSIYSLREVKPNIVDMKIKPAAKTRKYMISAAKIKILSFTV